MKVEGSIRSALVERLNKRIARLRKGQQMLAQRNLHDDLLDRAISRLTRIRTVLESAEYETTWD